MVETTLLAWLENGLFAVGQILRLPVMVLLWLSVLAVLLQAGSCVMEYLLRRKERQNFNIKQWLHSGALLEFGDRELAAAPLNLRRLLTLLQESHRQNQLDQGGLEHHILLAEEKAKQRLNLPRLLIKAGPSLGLIGTLIPMGSAMAGMASGDLQAMAGQMVVAFTTTIVGIACGTVAFAIVSVQQQWLNETIREQRYLAEHLLTEIQSTNGNLP